MSSDGPAEICRRVFRRYLDAGLIDDRAAAVAEAVEAGVKHNTAKTYYQRFRMENGLPRSVQAVRRRRKARESVKRPARLEGRKVQNGVCEPAEGSLMHHVWSECDFLLKQEGEIPSRRKILARFPHQSINTVTQARRMWRVFHGLPLKYGNDE